MGIPSLAALNPFGPIFSKELRTTARRKRTYFLRLFYLGMLFLFLLMAWAGSAGGRFDNQAMSVVDRQNQLAMLGLEFFETFSMFAVIAMAVIGPVLTSTAINTERLQKSLNVLLMTPITSWQIISGKLFSRLLIALTLLGLSLPVLALVRLLGSVEIEEMFAVICLAVSVALFTAALGLFFSVFINRAYAVILLSYATLLFLYLFVPFITGLMFFQNANGVKWMSTLAIPNPIICAALIAIPNPMGGIHGTPWITCCCIHIAMAAVLVLLSGLLLRRVTRNAGEKATGVADSEPAPLLSIIEHADGADMGPAALPARIVKTRRVKVNRTVADNPVLWRELRRPLMNKFWQGIVAAIACATLLGISYYAVGRDELDRANTQIPFAFVFHGLLTLLVCVLAATSIAQEKESDSWTILLTAPISGRQILVGKFFGVLRRIFWPMALFTAHFLIFVAMGVIDLQVFFLIIWVLFSFNVLFIATGIYLSLRIRKVTLAVILNLLVPVVIYILVPLVLSIFDELSRSRPSRYLSSQPYQNWTELVFWYLPYYYLAMAISEWRRQQHDYRLPGGDNCSPAWFLGIAIAIGMVHLGLCVLILGRAAARFNRIVGRAPQRVDYVAAPPALDAAC
ncbi:MAG TPA: ABC transporter permease subunit [Tepidisphaeraceae bacterium]|jgi:ABC-type transport system involved in multi-copper enzyme maturation permease subunit